MRREQASGVLMGSGIFRRAISVSGAVRESIGLPLHLLDHAIVFRIEMGGSNIGNHVP